MISGFLSAHTGLCLFYLGFISVFAIIITVYDKIAAKKLPQARVPEKTLLLLSVLGGSVAMYLCMLLIRHKTRHVKFMFGIPVILLLQAAALWAVFRFQI